jgi:phosphoribosylformimino-5-aminoimidazole carboxamide ribotide isomerase
VVALDHRQGKVLLKGWKETTAKRIERALVDFTEMGFKWFLVTDADRDGAMEGPDTETYTRLSRHASVIASGGVRSLGDLGLLKDSGVNATIIGKALYEQRFTLPEATRYLEEW